MSAAPLKQNYMLQSLRIPAASPHSHECGPVEAIGAEDTIGLCAMSLRTLMSAAPLKLEDQPGFIVANYVSALS